MTYYNDHDFDEIGMIREAASKGLFPDHPDFKYNSKEFKRAAAQAKKLMPNARLRAYRKTIGKKAARFFEFYKVLYMRYLLGLTLGEAGKRGDLAKQYQRAIAPLLRGFRDDVTLTRKMRNSVVDMKGALRKAENYAAQTRWKKVGAIYSAIIPHISKQIKTKKGRRLFLATKQMEPGWHKFWKMRKSRIKNEMLKDEAPDLYDIKVKMKKEAAEVNDEIYDFVKENTDYTPKKEYVRALNRHVVVGEDESTRTFTVYNRTAWFQGRDTIQDTMRDVVFAGHTFKAGKPSDDPEASQESQYGPGKTFNADEFSALQEDPEFDEMTSGRGHPLVIDEQVEKWVYPADNTGPYPMEEWVEDQLAYKRMEKDLAKQERLDEAEAEDIVEYMRLKSASSGLNEDTLQAIRDSAQPIEYVSITDDPSLQSRITRIFPTKKAPDEHPYNGRSVILEGRYKDMYLDDVINSEGRLIEGRHFDYKVTVDSKGNRKRVQDDTVDPLAESPHLSVSEDGRLYLRLPGDEGDRKNKPIRDILGSKAGDSGTLATAIDPPEYDVVRPGEPGYQGAGISQYTVHYKGTKTLNIAGVKLEPGESYTLTPEQMEEVSRNDHFNESMSGRSRTLVEETHSQYSRGYYFDPKHFGKIRDVLGGNVSMSREAADKLKRHFDELAAAEKATGLVFHLTNNTDETIKLEKANIEIPPGEEDKVTVEEFEDVKALRKDKKFRKLAQEYLKNEDGKLIDKDGVVIPLDENGKPTRPPVPKIEVEETNLRAYDLEQLGEFKEDMELLTKQKQALAWLEANGDKGVLALDTGLGKTICSIAHMQRLVKDGIADEVDADGNVIRKGRFLYVAPPSLLGNIRKEAYKFMKGGAADDLLTRLDVLKPLGRGGFSVAVKKKQAKLERYIENKEKTASRIRTAKKMNMSQKTVKVDPFMPEDYIAIYFDEAHKYMGSEGAAFKAATSFEHPRKVCLTASPVQGEPMDAFMLASVTSGEKLYEKDRKAAKNGARDTWLAKRRKFKKRYTTSVGGRVISITEDPVDKQALATWVKRNLFYADKQEVARDGEFKLKDPRRETVNLTMPKEMEKEYRETSKKITKELRAAVAKFQDYKFIKTTGKGITVRIRKRNEEGKLVDKEGNVIEDKKGNLLPGKEPVLLNPGISGKTIGAALEKLISKNPTTIAGWKGEIKGAMKKLFQLMLHPEDFVDGMDGNPKLDRSADLVRKKIEGGERTLLFTDDKKMVMKTARELSERVPGNLVHVACLPREIHFFQGGKQLKSWKVRIPQNLWTTGEKAGIEKLIANGHSQEEIEEALMAPSEADIDAMVEDKGLTGKKAKEFKKKAMEKANAKRKLINDAVNLVDGMSGYAEHKLPWHKRRYKIYGSRARKKGKNKTYPKTEWQKAVLDRIVTPNPRFATCTLHGPSYAEGHNLQAFTQVVHLDRDTWSNENMKQRTARAWRQGQENVVDVVNIDYQFADPKGQLDKTLDEIRQLFNEMESELFDHIIKESQETMLGKEWFSMQQRSAEKMKIDREAFELSVCPTLLAGLGD